jgi:hypothetical protein
MNVFFSSCERNNYTTDSKDKLKFSTDTVKFDTIFTSTGSATKRFAVRNPNSKKTINIDRIFLAKGSQSKYQLNINGLPSNNKTDIELSPGDSIFIFVMVNINPGKDEMLEMDSIIFLSNNNEQSVKLVAYGQDVILIDGQTIMNDTIWTPLKPILINNSALVDTFATLTVQAGTKIFFHKNSSLFIKGTIKAEGQVENRILFTGDRLEYSYSEIPGQWGAYSYDDKGNLRGVFGGIHLLAGSRYNELKNVDIKNSTIGLQVDSVVTSDAPSVYLKNVNIENSQLIGLNALGAHIIAENCVFANSGRYNVGCIIGGKYTFIHCTLANYWSGIRDNGQLMLNNYYTYKTPTGLDHVSYRPLESVYFGNCIIAGSKKTEISIDYNQGADMNLIFENCLIQYEDTAKLKTLGLFSNNIFNKDHIFKKTQIPYDYSLDTLSPAKDKGKLEIGQLVPYDQKGTSRIVDNKPDLGAFERQE